MVVKLVNPVRVALCIFVLYAGWYGALAAYGQLPDEPLVWDMKISQQRLYPGQALAMTISVQNLGAESESVFFGPGGIAAFSMQIHDMNGAVVCEYGRIRPVGFGESGICKVAVGEIRQKSIVLNRWCSTRLPVGRYSLTCDVEYWLLSEVIDHKLGPSRNIAFVTEIEIADANSAQFKAAIEDLAAKAFQKAVSTRQDVEQKQLAQKMLALTESDLAIPYQVLLLKTAGSTGIKKDIIRSLASSESTEAALALTQIVEQYAAYRAEDVRWNALGAIYVLRESGNPEILKATDACVTKYPHPLIPTITD